MLITVTKNNRSITADQSKCAGCMVCMLRCSFRKGKAFNPSASYIMITRLSGHKEEYNIEFTSQCDACLICARYCPYGALTAIKKGTGD